MNRKRTIKFTLLAMAASSVALFVSSSYALAQCAMCKNAITGSPNAAKLAQNFNFAIFVLLIPPVLIFCGVFIAAFKYSKAHGESLTQEKGKKNLLRVWLSKLSRR